MSLFGQLSGFQFPDVLMNSGPLPSTAGGPAGSDGSVDGVINGTSALLQNISPYAMGKSARTGSDRNYQQIPHRFQYIVPKLYLPRFRGDSHIPVSHAVDQGDVAFLLYGGTRTWWTSQDQFSTRAPPCAFATIEVVNYILLCIQASRTKRWGDIRSEFLSDPQFTEVFRRLLPPLAIDINKTPVERKPFDDFLIFKAVRLLVQEYFVPHGICAGSEHQGGQHETGTAPVQAAVNFVITMTVDGKNVDLVNYWYDKDMRAGDELVFTLEKKELKSPKYQLTSYYKDPVVEVVDLHETGSYWQLTPNILKGTKNQPTALDAWHHHRCQGYWRVAQTFQTRKANNINAFIRGLPLEVTFAPVWQSFLQCRDYGGKGHYFTSDLICFDPTKALTLRVKPTKMRWYYENDLAFQIIDLQNGKYETRVVPSICTVFHDAKKTHEPLNGATYAHQDLTDLHVIFGANTAPSNWKPHKCGKLANITTTGFRMHEPYTNKPAKIGYSAHLHVLQAATTVHSPEVFGAFNLTLTKRECGRWGHTSGFASWYCKESDHFLDFDCNFWAKHEKQFLVPIPKIIVGYTHHSTKIPPSLKSPPVPPAANPPALRIQAPDRNPQVPVHAPNLPGPQRLHMPEPLALEADLGPRKKRMKTFKLDAADAPGPLKAFKLSEDAADAPGPLKAFKLSEDAPGPTKRLKLMSTDDSGRAAV